LPICIVGGFLSAAEMHDKAALGRAVVKAARVGARAALPEGREQRLLEMRVPNLI
jgi:hypothetical protein